MDSDQKLVVVIVDDDAFTRKALCNLLQGYPCRVVEAGSGLEALRLISSQLPNLVLLDVRMPVMGGLEVLRELRSTPAFRDLAVMAMSGDTERRLVQELIELGISGFLVKPLFREEVTRRLDPVIASLLRGEATVVSRPVATVGERPRILIADADDNFRGFARPLLESRFEVLLASSGIEAYDLIERYRPPYALVGAGLPMLGENALARILQVDRLADTKLVLVTGSPDQTVGGVSLFHAIIRRSFIPDRFLEDLRQAGVLRDAASLKLSELLAGELRAPLISAIQQSIGVLASREARLDLDAKPESVLRQVAAKVSLASAIDAIGVTLTLTCSSATAEALGSQMLGIATSLNDGSLDAMGEIVNTIGGRLRESLANRGILLDLLFPIAGSVSGTTLPRAALSLVFVTNAGENFGVDVSVEE